MFRSKDFILMDVIDIHGKKIGFVKDIIIDFHNGEVNGVVVSSYRLFQKNINVLRENIISFNKSMVIRGWNKESYLKFSNIKDMDIINKYGDVIGITEDILFHEFTFKIHGIIVSTGLIKNIISGKKILLTNSLILGEKNMLYYKDKSNIDFVSVPHKLFTEVGCYEKDI
ncbi:PRC-barrel domain-containing protein [Clostridium sp. SYSU_GA19001]|uniref:PRC-barrel domain-containing protein n=1 Tax=Clostridium caldaquaticum TaxID=2940653 RepID=UPI00207778EC|nr:PRC-barrel domain-containing protein [Clostridium caldaquaticum]MCM8710457.1 PRC-barrel domain-containing protein [Clostridium caldaquaticum]